jgi:glycosyltransferase involved in cell wall biosynthesis
MRIIMFSNAYKPTLSGVVISIDLVRRGLHAAGHDVHLIVPEYHDYEDDEPYIFRFPAVDLREQWDVDLALVIPFKASMMTAVRGIKPDIIHSQHPFLMGGLAAHAAKTLNRPLIFTFHTRYDEYIQQYVSIAPELASVLTEEWVKGYLKKCSHIIAPTESIKTLIQEKYETEVPVSVVPTPVDLSKYHRLDPARIRNRLKLNETEILLYLGRLAAEKNIAFMIRAFAHIHRQRPWVRLLLVGKGPEQEALEAQVEKLELAEAVNFVGAIPYEEVPHMMAAADLFLFTSLTDTQGLVLAEAMAAGTPVVGVDAAGTTDVLAEGGGVVTPPDEECFAQAVIDLLADEPRRQALGERAKKAIQRFSPEQSTPRLLAVYEEAIASGPRLEG